MSHIETVTEILWTKNLFTGQKVWQPVVPMRLVTS